MSEGSSGNGDGAPNLIAVDPADLIDRLELVFDRATGTMRIGANVVNEEVILMMLYRAVNLYEFKTRSAFAIAAMQAAKDAQRVQSILDGHRPAGRG